MNRFDYQQWAAKANAKRGNELPQSRMTPASVREVRQSGHLTAKQLADKFGVHYRTIEKIRAYETWGHV